MKRSARLARPAWLGRGAGLSRSPRPRKAPAPAPGGDAEAALAVILEAEMTVAAAARVYGCDRHGLEMAARRAVRAFVMARDHGSCQNCGAPADDVQHRIARGMGGSSNPAIAFGRANLVALCRRCHDSCERERDETMHQRGFWLKTGEDPARVPVLVLMADGLRAAVWLGADGSRALAPPAGAAA